MINYWVLKVPDSNWIDECIDSSLWMMQYQYGSENAGKVTIHWDRARQIQDGDFALLRSKDLGFYAWGKVIKPRKKSDYISTVDEVLNNGKHTFTSGIVHYSDCAAFYEDLTSDEVPKWGQRIDVEKWNDYLPKGIHISGLKEATDNFLQNAILSIDKYFFEKVQSSLKKNAVKNLNKKNVGGNIMNNNSLNTILYGPPGTGKTYNVINKAVEIIDGKSNEVRDEVVKRYKELKEAGQIDFITFHQSFSYEEFIEGIKPENGANGNIEYNINDGIFKSICTRAKIRSISKIAVYDFDESKINFFKMSLGNSQDDGDDISRYCFENNVIAMGYGRNIDFSNANTKADIDKLYSPEKDDRTYPTQAVDRFKNWMKINDIVIISSGNHKVSAIGKVTGNYFFDASRPIDFKHYRNVEWLYTDAIIPVDQIMNNKVFSQQTIYEFYKKDLNMTNIKSLISTDGSVGEIKPFVLIIDEINRGNISKIFGELITLIEEDKRLGAENEITVTLPYSKEKFGVPSNLYIVGTMNTADRSIALMDTALRRRFTFEEMMPEPGLLKGIIVNDIDIEQVLSKINERIEFLYDRDHTIGHAYFINLRKIDNPKDQYIELCSIFSTKIIPLLQEYFYEDWEKIQLVLDDHIKQITGKDKDSDDFDEGVNGKRFIQSKLFKEKDILGFDHENYEDRVTYRINPDLNLCNIEPDAFTKIYKN